MLRGWLISGRMREMGHGNFQSSKNYPFNLT